MSITSFLERRAELFQTRVSESVTHSVRTEKLRYLLPSSDRKKTGDVILLTQFLAVTNGTGPKAQIIEAIILKDAKLQPLPTPNFDGNEFAFEITFQHHGFGLGSRGPATMKFICDTIDSRSEWMAEIQHQVDALNTPIQPPPPRKSQPPKPHSPSQPSRLVSSTTAKDITNEMKKAVEGEVGEIEKPPAPPPPQVSPSPKSHPIAPSPSQTHPTPPSQVTAISPSLNLNLNLIPTQSSPSSTPTPTHNSHSPPPLSTLTLPPPPTSLALPPPPTSLTAQEISATLRGMRPPPPPTSSSPLFSDSEDSSDDSSDFSSSSSESQDLPMPPMHRLQFDSESEDEGEEEVKQEISQTLPPPPISSIVENEHNTNNDTEQPQDPPEPSLTEKDDPKSEIVDTIPLPEPSPSEEEEDVSEDDRPPILEPSPSDEEIPMLVEENAPRPGMMMFDEESESDDDVGGQAE
ncbi:hypothetical protein BLNAU_13772 [Blattamonas nauphoetae]|uniref:PH domain-containing protein n=1 Tax=Blattamonas nauphoetae TaxID=2049346 RepID=A0ABQ9XJA6_9EUKA|nr:hypothetical protein BLNAU_13772 [Blattamonas nauphoetae]